MKHRQIIMYTKDKYLKYNIRTHIGEEPTYTHPGTLVSHAQMPHLVYYESNHREIFTLYHVWQQARPV